MINGWIPVEEAPDPDGLYIGRMNGIDKVFDSPICIVKLIKGKPFFVNGKFAFDLPKIVAIQPIPSEEYEE